jgi:uncharacterized membrane protein YhiD involved in acid resistance
MGVFEQIAISGKDIINIIFSMVLAFVIGMIISQVYKRTQRGMNHELTYMTSLVILAPIIALVMLFIRGNLILSLGLIGSLSIIRFRTAIKDTRDMIFLFWSIVVGLGAGTYNWTAVVIGSIIILAIIYVLYLLKYGKSENQDYILIITGESSGSYQEIETVVNQFVVNANIRSQEIQDGLSEIVLEVDFKSHDPLEIEKLTKQLYAINFVKSVSLLSPQLSLPA